MIALTREPDGEPITEPCCICGRLTRHWYAPKDVACCRGCAKTYTPDDLPSKAEWFEQVLGVQRG